MGMFSMLSKGNCIYRLKILDDSVKQIVKNQVFL